MDERRQKFEDYLRDKYGAKEDDDNPWFLWVHGDREHSYVYTQAEWEAWKAALSAATGV